MDPLFILYLLSAIIMAVSFILIGRTDFSAASVISFLVSGLIFWITSNQIDKQQKKKDKEYSAKLNKKWEQERRELRDLLNPITEQQSDLVNKITSNSSTYPENFDKSYENSISYYTEEKAYVKKKLKHQKEIYMTKATKRELEAKMEGKKEISYGIYGKRKIRPRLIYHISNDCASALADYENTNGVIYLNSGIIERQWAPHLLLCKTCGYDNHEPCDRCVGYGHIPKYNHIESGRCFKCDGKGYLN
jgi:hypothetical protein